MDFDEEFDSRPFLGAVLKSDDHCIESNNLCHQYNCTLDRKAEKDKGVVIYEKRKLSKTMVQRRKTGQYTWMGFFTYPVSL